MTLLEAQQKASQILDAERAEPTVRYMSPAVFANRAAVTSSPLGQRGWHPRPVLENPGYYYLESRNYALLKSLLDELDPNQRTFFFGKLRQRLSEPNPFRVIGQDVLGSGRTDRTNSELPLIAEFLVRSGDSAGLLSSLANAPLRPGLTRLLVHLEEMIALDYGLFSDDEYDHLESFALRTKSRLQELSRHQRIPTLWNPTIGSMYAKKDLYSAIP